MDVPPTPTLDVPVTATPDTPVNVITPAPADVTLPYNDMEEGAVATTPPLKAYAPAFPKVRVPVFKKVAALVMVEPPLSATLYGLLAVVNVEAVTAPVNTMLLVLSVRVTVLALTVDANVPPMDWVTVKPVRAVPEPIAPDTLNVPAVFKARLPVPATDVRETGVL